MNEKCRVPYAVIERGRALEDEVTAALGPDELTERGGPRYCHVAAIYGGTDLPVMVRPHVARRPRQANDHLERIAGKLETAGYTVERRYRTLGYPPTERRYLTALGVGPSESQPEPAPEHALTRAAAEVAHLRRCLRRTIRESFPDHETEVVMFLNHSMMGPREWASSACVLAVRVGDSQAIVPILGALAAWEDAVSAHGVLAEIERAQETAGGVA